MRPFSFLKRLWPRSERALTDGFAHPAEQMITPEIKRYLENHNWRNLRYPRIKRAIRAWLAGSGSCAIISMNCSIGLFIL